jgi:predicted NBD/HSP70 family sugar kinase
MLAQLGTPLAVLRGRVLLRPGTAIARRVQKVANERPASALGRLAAARAPLGEDVLDLARKGDKASVKVLQETGTWLGIGLAIFVNNFDPEVIAIGGVSRKQELWCWSLPAGSCGCGHTRLREIW